MMLFDVPLHPWPLAHVARATQHNGKLATGAPLHHRTCHGGMP